jgi:serine phosphatase RsbU (regulator of sigma subunit)
VVGVFDDAVYRDAQSQMPGNAFLTIYTDGVTEARRGRTLFGEQGLMRVLDEGTCEGIRTLPRKVLEEVSRHSGGRLADDIALISLCLGPGAPPVAPIGRLTPDAQAQAGEPGGRQ